MKEEFFDQHGTNQKRTLWKDGKECNGKIAAKVILKRQEVAERVRLQEEKKNLERKYQLSEKNRKEKAKEKLPYLRKKIIETKNIDVGLIISYEEGIEEVAYITNNIENENISMGIFHYSNEYARELLTATLRRDRNKTGNWKGNSFNVICSCGTKKILPLPTKILLKENGGFYLPKGIGHEEVVGCLIYSPYTKRFEIMKVTYNRNNETYYVDKSLFREFVQKYGKPSVGISYHISSKFNNSKLNEESLLKLYGYTVSEKDDPGDKKRKELLSELVDLEITNVSNIVHLLEFFISSHPTEKDYYAREKWGEDKEFIMEYKVNPTRFLIAQNSFL